MTKPKLLTAHPAAELFPSMSEGEYADLKADIRANGLHTPIDVFEGQILDGRHRYRACQELGLTPDLVKLDDFTIGPGGPVLYVISANLHRRHLSESQRAMLVAEHLDAPSCEKTQYSSGNNGVEPCAPGHTGGRTADAAGAAAGVSGRTVGRAKRVLESGAAEVVAAVKRGDVTVKQAEKIVAATPVKREQRRALQRISGGTKFDPAEFADAAPPAGLRDKRDVLIPEALRPAFANVRVLRGLTQRVGALLKEVSDAAALPGCERLPMAEIRDNFRNVQAAISSAHPTYVCKCRGKGCDICGDFGWLHKHCGVVFT